MVTVVAIDEAGETHLRRYLVETPAEAKDAFIAEWIAGGIAWQNYEYASPERGINQPWHTPGRLLAFTPEFLEETANDVLHWHHEETGVTEYEWRCVLGIHGSDEHSVTGYFIPSR